MKAIPANPYHDQANQHAHRRALMLTISDIYQRIRKIGHGHGGTPTPTNNVTGSGVPKRRLSASGQGSATQTLNNSTGSGTPARRLSASGSGSAVQKFVGSGTPTVTVGVTGDGDASQTTGISSDPTGTQASMADALVDTISVQLHLNDAGIYQTGWSSIVKPALLDLGVRHVRERLVTSSTVISRYQDLASNGIRLIGGCWPASSPYNNADHIITRANSYGTDVIEAFDGWNEVDGQSVTGMTWPQAWVAWQTALYNKIKGDATWQDRVVLGNSLASASSCDSVGDQHTILDAGNMHSYPTSSGMPSAVSNSWIPQWQKISGSKPLWTTEAGYHNALAAATPGISQLATAKYYSRFFFEYFNRGVVRANLYELMDEGVSNTDREMSWGLVAFDGTPKQQYAPVKNVIALLSDAGSSFTPGKLNYTLTGALSTTHTSLFQKRNGHFYLVIWQEIKVVNSSFADITNAADAVTLTLGTPATAINVYRPRTGTGTIQTGSGTSIALSVPDEALIVEIIR